MLWAFRKLSKRDRTVLAVAGILFFAAFVSCLFLIMSGVFFNNVKFPESTLDDSRDGALQTYRLGTYKDLDITVAFPGTAYGIDLKGTELSDAEDGALFEAEEGVYIFVGTIKKEQGVADFLSGRLPSLFSSIYLQGMYQEKVNGTGYLNTVYAEYCGGIVSVGEDDYYCMAYRYPTEDGSGRDIIFGTARAKKKAATIALKWDKTMILDKMFFTIKKNPDNEIETPILDPLEESAPIGDMDVSDGDVSDGGNTDTENSFKGNEDLYSPAPSDGGGANDNGEDTEILNNYDTPGEKMAEVIRKQKEDDFSLAYPGQEIFHLTAEVPEELAGEKVAVRIEFTEVMTDIYFATIKNDVTGRIESAEYLNEDNDGIVIFYIEDCEPGIWSVEIERHQSLGSYFLDVREASLLKGIYAPNEDHPRP